MLSNRRSRRSSNVEIDQPGNQRPRCKCSSTELLEHNSRDRIRNLRPLLRRWNPGLQHRPNMHCKLLFKTRRGTCEKRFDSRPVSAATLSFGTTPPDPRGSRRCRRSVARQGSRPCSVDRSERSSSSLSPPAKLLLLVQEHHVAHGMREVLGVAEDLMPSV